MIKKTFNYFFGSCVTFSVSNKEYGFGVYLRWLKCHLSMSSLSGSASPPSDAFAKSSSASSPGIKNGDDSFVTFELKFKTILAYFIDKFCKSYHVILLLSTSLFTSLCQN